jgi:hypothetical protein
MGVSQFALLAGLLLSLQQTATSQPVLTSVAHEGQVEVSFDLRPATADDLLPALVSCQRVAIRYVVELHHVVPFGLDRLVGRAAVTNVADCLAANNGELSVQRTANWRTLVNRIVPRDEAVGLLTTFAMALTPQEALDPRSTYIVRVTASVDRGTLPTISTGSLAQARVTFAP